MAAWDATSNVSTITKAEAIAKIKVDARAAGYTGGFKVMYDGAEVVTPDDLPSDVDYSLIKIASKLNNA